MVFLIMTDLLVLCYLSNIILFLLEKNKQTQLQLTLKNVFYEICIKEAQLLYYTLYELSKTPNKLF